MKLHDINAFAGCYIYSTSHRFCFPFTFAPFTTVGPLDRDFSKAISIMWNRKDRGQLRALHDDLMNSLIGHRLQRLHEMSVMAFAFKGTYKGERGSMAAVKWLADDGFVAGSDHLPFSQLAISCMRSFAPTRLPSAEQLSKAQHFWASVRDDLTKGGNQSLAESLVPEGRS
jgi:hypothetical protein